MAPETSKNWPRRRDNQRGGVLIELAMVIVPLMTILLGLVEIGGAWRDKSAAVQASRAGARVATTSSMVPDPLGDREALRAVLAGLPTGSSGASAVSVRKVIIFNASSITDIQAHSCNRIGEIGNDWKRKPTSGTPGEAGLCNVYLSGNAGSRNSLVETEIDAAPWGNSSGDWNGYFTPSSRTQDIQNPTKIGVYVELYRPWVTGFFPGDGTRVNAFTVMNSEPAGL